MNATLLRDLAEAMFRVDERRRLIGHAPDLHIIRTPDVVIFRCHAELPDVIAEALTALAEHPRSRPGLWSHEYGGYAQILAGIAPLRAIRAGPLYGFPESLSDGDATVRIDERNLDLLRGGLDEWRSDVAAGAPAVAVVADGRAAAICASVRVSAAAHCAGVETLSDYRRRGLATRAVAGWARMVRAGGAEPFYGTTFDNVASQAVARRLGLIPIGGEFSIECGGR